MRWTLVATVALLAAGFACKGRDDVTEKVPDRVTGVIVEIDSESITDVTSFVLKDGDDRYTIFISNGVNYGFPLSHLNAHRASGEPVRVELGKRNGRLIAMSIEDA